MPDQPVSQPGTTGLYFILLAGPSRDLVSVSPITDTILPLSLLPIRTLFSRKSFLDFYFKAKTFFLSALNHPTRIAPTITALDETQKTPLVCDVTSSCDTWCWCYVHPSVSWDTDPTHVWNIRSTRHYYETKSRNWRFFRVFMILVW